MSIYDDKKLYHKSLKGIRSLLLPIAKGGKIQRQIVQDYVSKLVVKEAQYEAAQRAVRLRETMDQFSTGNRQTSLKGGVYG